MAQIPAVRAELGYECREVWTVDKGNKLVGIDASGLELRMLAHYMQDPEYTKAVCEGTQEDGTDVHSRNMRLAGLDDRDQAKTFIYAFLYGAGDGKIGQIVNGTAADGAALRERFLKGLPALGRLITTVQKIADEKGSLPSLDGRRLGVRHQHAALNTLLQGAGAVVMKEWLVVFDNHLTIGKYPAKFVANVHDEVQIEVKETFAEDVAKIGVDCFDIVTANLSLRCPLAGDYKIGNNWSETH
jgi:DNA polymerase I-like protein with 3'-5' exonuclease and polymerase domains